MRIKKGHVIILTDWILMYFRIVVFYEFFFEEFFYDKLDCLDICKGFEKI